jgi:hypothetical protein
MFCDSLVSGSARTRFGDRLFFLDFGMGGGLLDRSWFRRSKLSYTVLVHNGVMKVAEKAVRQSVSLPPRVAKQVGSMAKSRKLSKNRMLLELIENGIDAEKRKQQQFFALAERFRNEQDPEAANRLGDELGRMVFGG